MEQQDIRLLASTLRKVLPPTLLAEVLAHLDPLTPFLAALRKEATDSGSRLGDREGQAEVIATLRAQQEETK